jgi:hypothetical protein
MTKQIDSFTPKHLTGIQTTRGVGRGPARRSWNTGGACPRRREEVLFREDADETLAANHCRSPAARAVPASRGRPLNWPIMML